MLAPGSTIGILGGGQLGRMTALAAARLGYRCHVFADEPDSPAAQVCGAATVAEFSDREALEGFAGAWKFREFAEDLAAAVRLFTQKPDVVGVGRIGLDRQLEFLGDHRNG